MTSSIVPTAHERAERRTKYHEADVVVVGAGVVGCAAAYALADQGRSVLLLERWLRKPDRIVGELLQPGGVAALRKLGLIDCLEGIDAVPCYGYDVVYHNEHVLMSYPYLDERGALVYTTREEHLAAKRAGSASASSATAEDASLLSATSSSLSKPARRPEGRSFHHGNFIQKLRDACAAHPNITIFETEVTGTIRGTHGPEILGVQAKTLDKESGTKVSDCFFGQLTIIADGYDSKFRKQLLPKHRATPEVRSKFYALELLGPCPLPNPGFGHVVISDTGACPVLLYQIGSESTRALIDVPIGLPAASPANGGVKGYMRDIVLPALPQEVRPAFARALDALGPTTIPKSMPNSWLPPSQMATGSWPPGIALLGDAANMRHPLTGGGMTVALNDVVQLADLLAPRSNGGVGPRVPISLSDTRAVRAALRALHWRRKSLTAIINVLAQALYALFSARDAQLAALQRGCIEYLRRGFVDAPLGLLGGVVHEPLVLANHFFTVAFLAIWINAIALFNRPGVGSKLVAGPLALLDAVLILWKACIVFLPVMWRELW